MAKQIRSSINFFKIHIGKRFFLSSSALFGDLFFEFDNGFFPCKDWNDFTIEVLNWWISALLELSEGKPVDCLYLDGSFMFTVKMNHQKQCIVRFIEGGLGEKEVIHKELQTSLKDLMGELISACEDFFEVIKAPDSLKLIEDGTDIDPKELMNEIHKNPRILEDFNVLVEGYQELLKQKEFLDTDPKL